MAGFEHTNAAQMEISKFKNPLSEYSVTYTWAWNSKLSKALIKQQIDKMNEAGIKSFYILPLPKEFRPTWMITEMEPDYLSDEFIEYTKYAIEYASTLGMVCWLYDEGGWPSGSACGLVNKACENVERKVLDKRTFELKAGERYTASEDAVSAFVGKNRIFDGQAFEADTTVAEYYMQIDSYQFADIYAPKSVDIFVELTHKKYKEKMSDIMHLVPYMFTDEPAGRQNSVSEYILDGFKSKYGYDLRDYIYVLIDTERLDEQEYKARLDYAELLCDLMKASIEKLRAASHECGLDLVGHLDNDHVAKGSVINGYGNILSCLKKLDIPGVDVILGHIRSSGNELGEGNDFFPRLASSAAYQNGTVMALSESCSVYGNSLSFDEIRYILNYQLVRGINIFNLMLMPLTVDKWYGYGQRPYFHSSLPGFYALGDLNTKMARSCYFMSVGIPAVKCALFMPYEDFWKQDDESRASMEGYKALGERLEHECIDFDIIDAETIRAGILKDGVLSCGVAQYAKIYIPENATVPSDVLKIIGALNNKLPSYIKTDNSDIKTKVNTDISGNLYICLFNQSTSAQKAKISVCSDKRIYRFDVNDGRVKAFENHTELEFRYGECVFLYASNDSIDTDIEMYGKASEIYPCKLTKIREFKTPRHGAEYVSVNEEVEVNRNFAVAFGKDFSGEARYEFEVNVEDISDCIIEVEKIEYSATVYVNGRKAGYMTCAPYKLHIPGELFDVGINRIWIDVENLAANRYNATPIESYYAPEYIGPYNAPSEKFESEVGGGGLFGAVKLIFIEQSQLNSLPYEKSFVENDMRN